MVIGRFPLDHCLSVCLGIIKVGASCVFWWCTSVNCIQVFAQCFIWGNKSWHWWMLVGVIGGWLSPRYLFWKVHSREKVGICKVLPGKIHLKIMFCFCVRNFPEAFMVGRIFCTFWVVFFSWGNIIYLILNFAIKLPDPVCLQPRYETTSACTVCCQIGPGSTDGWYRNCSLNIPVFSLRLSRMLTRHWVSFHKLYTCANGVYVWPVVVSTHLLLCTCQSLSRPEVVCTLNVGVVVWVNGRVTVLVWQCSWLVELCVMLGAHLPTDADETV